MKIALCGAGRSGKTTLFEILTGAEHASRGGGGRPEAKVGVARVPDPRLDRLSEMYSPKKTTPATLTFVDLAPLEAGSRGDAAMIAELRGADSLLLVVRSWDDEADPHPAGSIDPARDVDLALTEFLLADLDVVGRRLEKLETLVMKANRPDEKAELALLKPVAEALESGKPVRDLGLSPDDEKALRGYGFLTAKPILVTVNLAEDDTGRIGAGPDAFGLEELLSGPHMDFVALSAKIEAEIAALPPDDAAVFREDLGLTDSALDRMLRACYHMLGLMTFFTVGEDECRAWTVPRGSKARDAAGAIHSDLQRGFIRAEVIAYETLMAAGTWNHAKETGQLRIEGKDHVINDGDIMHVRFAV